MYQVFINRSWQSVQKLPTVCWVISVYQTQITRHKLNFDRSHHTCEISHFIQLIKLKSSEWIEMKGPVCMWGLRKTGFHYLLNKHLITCHRLGIIMRARIVYQIQMWNDNGTMSPFWIWHFPSKNLHRFCSTYSSGIRRLITRRSSA